MTGDAIDLNELQRKYRDFAVAFSDDIDSTRLVDEIQDVEFLSADVIELT